ncbi:MAG TPA: hypothetical protein VMV02_03795 [Acidimicrobiales bacterium]|nr:hypothetical protein [Acidimicrobiales bacterium]
MDGVASSGGRRALSRGALSRGDRRAIAVLVGAPLLVFTVPALAGYPLVTGDDVIQNFPLRALAGALVRHGHLPVFDPFTWSGSALLGGINAGAAFPGILLWALLPPLAAWVATQVAAYAAAAVGIYALCRLGRLAPLPAALGGAAYAFTGFVSSQAVHVDVVEACASLAWLLVGLERVAHARRAARPGWTALAAACAACLGLAGSPEIAFYAAVGAAVYAAHLVLHAGGERWRVAAAFLAAAATGTLLAGVQLATGAAVVATSQRASVGTSFLTAGSLDWGQLTTLVAPHLLGGGPIGLRPYVGSYNLAEIDGYPGMLALVAITWLATRWRSPGAVRWRVWYVVGAIGLLVAIGSATPLPHLLAHLPVVGSSRLPSRALVLVALAASMLLAHFADDVLETAATPVPGASPGATAVAGPSRPSCPTGRETRRARLAGALPPVAVLALLATAAIGGRTVARAIAGQPIGPWSVGRVAPWLALDGLVALAAGAFALWSWRLDPRARARALLAIAVLDIVLFAADQSSLAPVYSRALQLPSTLSRHLGRLVGPGGRFVVVDPSRAGGIALDELGAPDLTALSHVASAQGYGSLVWGPYARATGTHGQDVASPGAIAGTTFDSLGVSVLLVGGTSFMDPVHSPSSRVAATVLDLRPGHRTTRLFGAGLQVATVRLSSPAGARLTPAELGRVAGALGLVDGRGRPVRTRTLVAVGTTGAVASFDSEHLAAGIVVRDPLGTPLSRLGVVVTTAAGDALTPTGALARAATPPHWTPDGTLGPYTVLRNSRAAAPYTLVPAQGVPGGARSAATVQVLRAAATATAASVAIDAAAPATLVRSVADIPGWIATVTHDGRERSVPVRRLGVVQAVRLPAGRSVVRFSYVAPGLDAGLGASAAGTAALAGLIAAALVRRRREGGGGAGRRGAPEDAPQREPRRRARADEERGGARRRARVRTSVVVALAAVAAAASACGGARAHAVAHGGNGAHASGGTTAPSTTSASTTSATAAPTAPSSGGPATTSGPSGSGPATTSGATPGGRAALVAGKVTVVGDSVLLDYSALLAAAIPGATIEAAVGRQWLSGVALVRALRARGDLGATVVVALGTNGPVTTAGFDQMMAALSGARRVVVVTVHVDRPWQHEVNTVLRAGARRFPRLVVADWSALASAHPGWFYSDGTHLPIDGPGAHALAALVAGAVRAPPGRRVP